MTEAVPFDVVRVPRGDRRDHSFEVGRVHLVVPGHDGDDVGARLEGAAVSRHDRRTDPAILRVSNDVHARISARHGDVRHVASRLASSTTTMPSTHVGTPRMTLPTRRSS